MAVKDIIEREIANGFASFEGLSVQGSVPVRAPLVNEIMAEFLKADADIAPGAPGETKSAAIAANAKAARPSLSEMKRMVKSASVRFMEGVMVVDFEVRR